MLICFKWVFSKITQMASPSQSRIMDFRECLLFVIYVFITSWLLYTVTFPKIPNICDGGYLIHRVSKCWHTQSKKLPVRDVYCICNTLIMFVKFASSFKNIVLEMLSRNTFSYQRKDMIKRLFFVSICQIDYVSLKGSCNLSTYIKNLFKTLKGVYLCSYAGIKSGVI